MAKKCVEIMLKHLGGRKEGAERIVLETELIQGDTVKKKEEQE